MVDGMLNLASDIIDYGVVGLLGILSVVSLWIFIERMMFYKTINFSDYTHPDELELELSNNINIISTIGANAPYIGLLGTVLGIMLTFYTLGDLGAVDAKKIMIGLAMALKATAAGLLVAIPSIIFYTILNRKIERIMIKYDIANES